jgi:hypothetical protein
MSHRTSPARTARLSALLTLTMLTLVAWLRREQVTDDRGSESTEKALMVILAITLGTAVTGAAVAYVATKTSLFK